MAFDFEALVGHLYVVGGRSISTAPPGALVEVAPRKAQRGRETDTFFTLVLPSGEVNAPTSFYERMAKTAAEHYFNSGGSVTAGLRSAFNTLNQNLYDHNESAKQPYEADMLCAVLHNDSLFVGRVGAGVSVLRYNGQTKTLPEDVGDDEALFKPPMGVQPVPEVHMARYTVGNGSRLILGDSNLAEFETEKITGALLAQDLGEVLAALRELVMLQTTLMVVEFVPPETPATVPVHEGESTTEVTAQIAAARTQARTSGSEKTSLSRLSQTSESVQKQTRHGLRRGLGIVALGLARGMELTSNIIDHFFPQAGEGKRRSIPLTTAAAVLVPVTVVVLVVALWLTGTGVSEFEMCVEEATGAGDIAFGIDPNNRDSMLAAWTTVLEIVERCNAMRPGDETLAVLQAEGQRVIDGLNEITRREARPLASFPDAVLTRIELQGNNLFVMDDDNDWVYHAQLSVDGRELATVGQLITGLSRGATVGRFTVGDIIDIAFNSQENMITVLDSTGLLVQCPPRLLLQCEAQRLLAAENWGNPISITFWQGRLYVLDPGVGQIWRYEPSGSSYTTAPTEYFGGARPNLSGAVDFGIDISGRIYILSGDGRLTKYYGGEAQVFNFASFPAGQELASASAMFLNNNPVAQTIFVVNRNTRTIYETTFVGTFIGSYRAFDESRFTLLADVAADPGQNLIYAVSGNSIFVFDKTG